MLMIGPAPTLGGGLYAAGSGGGYCDVTTSTVDTAAPPSPCIMPLGNPAGFAFNPVRPTGGGRIGVVGPGTYCIIASDGHVECGLLGGSGGSGGGGGCTLGGGGGNCSGGGDNTGGNKILYTNLADLPPPICDMVGCETCGGGTGPPPPGGGPPGGGGDCPPDGGGSCTPPPGGPMPVPVPDSSAPFSQFVSIGTIPPTDPKAGMLITCANTGVTLPASCSGTLFYHTTSGTKSYSVPAGQAIDCETGDPIALLAGANSGDVSTSLTIRCHFAP